MKFVSIPRQAFVLMGLSLFSLTGCHTDPYVGSPYHVGPTAGMAVGDGVGIVAGNVVGAGAGAVQGTVAGTAAALDPSYRMVRQWRTETTADGRTIQVPYDIMVDKFGRPVLPPAPTGNPPAAPVPVK